MRRVVSLLALAALVCLAAAPARAQDALAEARAFAEGAGAANGKLVYLAGYNLKVERMQFMGGPQWLQMQGGSCASCHGPSARGGMYPPQCDRRTPAVDFATLAGLEGARPEGGEPYTVPALRRALEHSRDPSDRALDPCMPRWYLGDEDFRDLTAHLLRLGAR